MRRDDRHFRARLALKRLDDGCSDLVLDLEDVGHLAIEPLGPELIPVSRADQFDGDSHPVVVLPYTSVQDGADVQHLADLAGVPRLTLELKRRGAGGNT